MNYRRLEQARFFEEQLFEARNALFVANSVKRIKFLQNRIKFLQGKINEVDR
ncbi:MAG TPA: hypothetical protein VJ343_00760 [archaeon]|nr:hypothetical protein [archaeon]